jgi:hypothetical protein
VLVIYEDRRGNPADFTRTASHVPGRRPFGHQVGELGVVAELFLLDGGGHQDGYLPQLEEQVIQEVQGVRIGRVQVIDQQKQRLAGPEPAGLGRDIVGHG